SVHVEAPFRCDYGTNIELGERVFFNFNCVVLDVCSVRIGSFSLLGPAVQIYTATHPMDAMARRRHESGAPVEIGTDVWVGGGAIILPGVTIGSRAVIGAGSVVTRDVPEGMFAAGNPCRVIRALDGGAGSPAWARRRRCAGAGRGHRPGTRRRAGRSLVTAAPRGGFRTGPSSAPRPGRPGFRSGASSGCPCSDKRRWSRDAPPARPVRPADLRHRRGWRTPDGAARKRA